MCADVFESYETLWGELMFIMHGPEQVLKVNEGRADWVESLGLGSGLSILDLGCGNGVLDIALARRGHRVVGVDQVDAVIESARRQMTDESVSFVVSDLRDIEFGTAEFDAVLMFGLIGLMSRDDDLALLRRVASWLRPGGVCLVDIDRELAETQTTEADHQLGRILWHWTSDTETRTNRLTPELHRRDGMVVGLRDPIDPTRGDHEGLHRYIYPQEELELMVTAAGLKPIRVGHFLEFVFPGSDRDRYMIRAERPR